MANPEHVERLEKGVEAWNQWRKNHADVEPDLSSAELRDLDLTNVNLAKTNLERVFLHNSNLERANLEEANLSDAYLPDVRLNGATLSNARLQHAFLSGSNLTHANFTEADLTNVYLGHATLIRTRFINASLVDADLTRASALEADFTGSNLTGACIQEWNIGFSTTFNKVTCDYIFLQQGNQERRPSDPGTIFRPGEFVALIQKSLDTIDLIFVDGIDWQAFFQSFQELRNQYTDQDLSIQAIEKKRGGAFVVRVEVPPEVDKTVIESRAKELYTSEVKALEAQYEERLRLQGQHLEDARQTIEVERQAVEAERRDKATLMGVIQTMASSQQGPKYDMRGAQIAGGVADTVQGDQHGGIINNYGSSAEDITCLLSTLRDQAQDFPAEQKGEALDILDDLVGDLSKPEPDQGRIGRRLKKLVVIATLLTGLASGASTVSGDLSDFTSNVIELTEKLGIPIEQVQLPPSNTP